MRHILSSALALTLGASLAGCADQAPSTADAEQALVAVGRPASDEFAHGSFDFSRPITGVADADERRLASVSWDVYYVLDDGDVGSWGAGMDVFEDAAAAETSAAHLATFWVCDGPRETVDLDRDGYDVLEASTCRRPTEDGYYATLSAAKGRVTANLTLASHDRDVAADALAAVWRSLSTSTDDVVADVS